MLFFIFIFCIEGLQLELKPYEYQKGRNMELAYSVMMQIQGSQYQMVIDSSSQYSWLYAKNPINDQLCINCPQEINLFDCTNIPGCKVKSGVSEITLENSNKCILAENALILDGQFFDKFELCLVYEVTKIEYKVNGAFSVAGQSELFHQLVQKQQDQKFQVNIKQLRLFVSETSSYSIQKPTLFQNQDLNEWKLQFQLFQREKQFLTKSDNTFIDIDLTTKYLWFTEDVIMKIIKEIKDYDDLFCSIERSRVMCLCSQSDFINKIPKLKIGFNGLKDKFNLPLDPIFIKDHQKCQLGVFKADRSVLGNQFFKYQNTFSRQNGAIFDQQQNVILIGQQNQDEEQQLVFNFSTAFCIIAGLLMIFGFVALLLVLGPISQDQLNSPKYYQEKAKPLFVLSKKEFRPTNLELSTNKQMIYQKRK